MKVMIWHIFYDWLVGLFVCLFDSIYGRRQSVNSFLFEIWGSLDIRKKMSVTLLGNFFSLCSFRANVTYLKDLVLDFWMCHSHLGFYRNFLILTWKWTFSFVCVLLDSKKMDFFVNIHVCLSLVREEEARYTKMEILMDFISTNL